MQLSQGLVRLYTKMCSNLNTAGGALGDIRRQ